MTVNGGSLTGLGLPQARRKHRVSFTPLADAMFQLLIFFMVSSSLTPYSLLLLRSGEADLSTQQPATGSSGGADQALDSVLWELRNGAVVFENERFPIVHGSDIVLDPADEDEQRFLDLAARSENLRVTVALCPQATVADMTRALEALTVAKAAEVRLARLDACSA